MIFKITVGFTDQNKKIIKDFIEMFLDEFRKIFQSNL